MKVVRVNHATENESANDGFDAFQHVHSDYSCLVFLGNFRTNGHNIVIYQHYWQCAMLNSDIIVYSFPSISY